jgi:hypothetical protein
VRAQQSNLLRLAIKPTAAFETLIATVGERRLASRNGRSSRNGLPLSINP